MNKPNLKTFKDKRVQLGLAAAAALGLVVLVRKGSGDTTAGSGSDGSGSSLNTGTLDSTGTDSYNAISQLGQAWQDQWNQAFEGFQDSLTGIQTQLGNVNPPGSQTQIQVMPINPKLKQGQGFYLLKPGDTPASVESRFGISDALFKALNPGGKLAHMGVGEAVRVRATAGPPPGPNGRLWR